MLANRRITIREVAGEIEISYGLCEGIFTNVLNMKLVYFAPGQRIGTHHITYPIVLDKTQNRCDVTFSYFPNSNGHSKDNVFQL